MSLIKIKKVRKTYRPSRKVEVHALRGVDIDIKEGEFVALMGASGSGKSTLMNIVGLLDTDFEGTYEFKGQDVGKLKKGKVADLRGREIGFVFQQFNLLKRTTVVDNILLPTVYNPVKGQDRVKKAFELVKKVGLEDVATHKSNELSGGQMQRVAIARALMTDPDLILADEPTGNLDSVTAREIMELLDSLNKNEGKTVILITHEDEIAKYADRTTKIRDGKLLEGKKK